MTDTPAVPPHHPGQRIAKAMARAGLCSRRDAEAWILAGRVSVNGEVLTSPAVNVVDSDDIRIDGEPLQAHERTRLFLFHKPRGLVTTARDPEGRRTIFDALPADLPRVVAVGRLDINTEGLLLLTNDGGLARVLELPATGWLRRYRVRAHGAIDQAALDSLRDGVSIEGVHYAGIEARLERTQGSNVWMTMGLREGKNREIKRVLEHLGLSVNRLIRISFGPFELADLAEGEVVEARTRVLRDQLGPRLAREAGVDFDAPIVERAEPAPPPATETRRPSASAAKRPPRRAREEPAPRNEPRREPPRSAPPERKRKHVGALRAEIAAAAAGPRKRIERSATSDRHGRVVAVERVLPTREEERRRELARRKAEARRESRAPRAGKPFEARDRGEGGQRPLRRSAGRFGDAPGAERRGGETAPREDRAQRTPRADKSFEPRNRAEGGERPARRPGGRFGEERSAEVRGGDSPPREDRAPRTPRAGKPFEPRNWSEGGERSSRRPAARSGEGRSAEVGGGGPAPREHRAPRAGKPFAPRNRSEGGERPPRRPDARFGEGRSGDVRDGETASREHRAPRAGKPFAPRHRAEGDERPPRRSGGRFGAAPGASPRSGESAPREDKRPHKPRLNKPFAKRPFGGKGRGGPRDGRPGGARPPRRP
jgi:23S rRNA pseudouridine2605 synthase